MGETLFLAHRAPWPPDRGDRIRSWHLLDALLRRGPVHVVALADDEADRDAALAKLEPVCASVTIAIRRPNRLAAAAALLTGGPVSVALFDDRRLKARVRGLLAGGRVDRIVAFSGQMAPYIPDRAGWAGRAVLDLVDVDSAKFASYGAAAPRWSPMGWINRREGRVLAAAEARWARRMDATCLVSEAEAALFRARAGVPADRVVAIDNGIDTDRFDPAASFDAAPSASGPRIVFTGQMDYRPNIEAVRWFADAVLPAVRARHADASFAIVGRAPTAAVLALGERAGVTVTGAVADVRGWIAAADVVVAPLLTARGIQNKVLEAMAMARPVVATPAAAEGIEAIDGRDWIIAGTPAAQADAVSGLIADPARAAVIGRAARARMIERYGWDACLAPFVALVEGREPDRRPIDEVDRDVAPVAA